MATKEMGVVPGSPLATLLARLPRPERRMLLAVVQSPPGPRRTRLEKRLRARMIALGVTS